MTIIGWVIFGFIVSILVGMIIAGAFFGDINEKEKSLFKKRNSNKEGRTSRRIKEWYK